MNKISHPSSLPYDLPKENFLISLAGKSLKYKRYGGLPLRYAGGKSLAVGHILEYIPENITQLISPFFGGGSVEIACARELKISVKGYDVFDVLATYWQKQIANPRTLADTIAEWKPTRSCYRLVKERLKKHWDDTKRICDPLTLAAHYWFNHNLSYGPGFLGWMSSIYEDEARFHRLLSKVRSFDVPNLQVEQGDFANTLQKHQDDFLYCDPPYYLEGDSKMFRGIYPQRNFPVHHKTFDHKQLHRLLTEHRGGFVLSYNDCSMVRKLYRDCDIYEVSWQYTLGQGEARIGKNRINMKCDHIKKSHELLIVRQR